MSTVLTAIGWIVVLSPGTGTAQADDAAPFIGSYAGWAYENESGDFPIRLHVRKADGKLSVSVDAPHQKAFGLSTSDALVEGGQLRFQRRNRQGNLWFYSVSPAGRDLRGEATLDGKPYCWFLLHRSDEPLLPVEVAKNANLTGIYRGAGGRTVQITSWFWGELRMSDVRSGRDATLFASGPDRFFVGPALYIPSPVTARLAFERDGKGEPARLVYTEGESSPETLQRLPVSEEDIEFSNAGATLRGTLIKPEGPGPFPATVVLGGSGWRTREDTRREGNFFVSMGLAALIYDQRGHGKSTGEPVCGFETTAADARAAVSALSLRPDIRKDRIGLSGRSRGGWFAPLAASGSDRVGFVVIFVPPSISPARQETTRRLSELKASGVADADMEEARTYLDLVWKATRSDEDWERYRAARSQIEERGWLPYLEGIDSKESEDYAWSRLNMLYDPIPALEKVTCPLLALFGEADENVTPSENLPPMEAALQRGGNKQFSLQVIPRADHGLRLPAHGEGPPRSALHRGIGVSPQVWPMVHDWLSERGINGRK